MNHESQPTETQTAIAQTIQPADNPILNFADRYPISFEYWVWLILIIQLLKLRNGGND